MGRRRYLSVLGGAMAGVGRRGSDTTRNENRNRNAAAVPWPEVSEVETGGWHEAERSDRTFAEGDKLLGISGRARTVIYGYEPVQRAVEARFGVAFDRPLVTFFASRIRLEGYFTAAVSADAIADRIESEFVDRLENRGVRDIREADPTDPRPDVGGNGARFTEYRGTYRLPGRATVPDGGGERRVRVLDRDLPVAAFFAVRKEGTATAYVAGGAYPAANAVQVAAVDDGDEITVALGFDTAGLRAQLVELSETVE